MVVEAALAVPVFLIACVALILGFAMHHVESGVSDSLINTSLTAHYETDTALVLLPAELSNNNSFERGIDSMSSANQKSIIPMCLPDGDYYDLRADYALNNQLVPGVTSNKDQRILIRSFNGYEPGSSEHGEEDEYITMFMTEHGEVYHRTAQCTYLKLSVKSVPYGQLSHERSDNGNIYYPCDKCGKGLLMDATCVWITDDGYRFHLDRGCSTINRSIREIMIKKENELKECSRCGGK